MATKKVEKVTSDPRPFTGKEPEPVKEQQIAGDNRGLSFEERGREMDRNLGRENRH